MATNAERIAAAVERAAGKGLQAAGLFLSARLRETLNVPAPRKRVHLPGGGMTYRATTPATPGAPPRKVTGALQRSVTLIEKSPTRVVISVSAKSEKNFSYPKHHEVRTPGSPTSGRHPFIAPTVERYRAELTKIVGDTIRLEVNR